MIMGKGLLLSQGSYVVQHTSLPTWHLIIKWDQAFTLDSGVGFYGVPPQMRQKQAVKLQRAEDSLLPGGSTAHTCPACLFPDQAVMAAALGQISGESFRTPSTVLML